MIRPLSIGGGLRRRGIVLNVSVITPTMCIVLRFLPKLCLCREMPLVVWSSNEDISPYCLHRGSPTVRLGSVVITVIISA